MRLSRRGLLGGLLAMPAIVRTPGLLMPVSRILCPLTTHYYGTCTFSEGMVSHTTVILDWLAPTTAAPLLSYTITGLRASTEYTFRLVATRL